MRETLKKLRKMNPKTHPRLFRVLAVVIGGTAGLILASYVSGWPAALWGH
jgi:hypothetical protein